MSAETVQSESVGSVNYAILLVDDEPNVLAALRRSLRKTPHVLLSAANGEQAMAILERQNVDLVIADYLMPIMDGLTLLRNVKEHWPDIQRVMLTGNADLTIVEHAINESEVFRFINKPWSEGHLLATVRECLEHLQLIQSNRRYAVELEQRNAELRALNLELEKKVQERTRALVHSEKMNALGQMAGGLAHEINNPLGGILAFVQILLRDRSALDSKDIESLSTIESCALRCKSIVENLLLFSRKHSSEEQVIDEIDLNQAVQNALKLGNLHPRAVEIEIRLDLCGHPLRVKGQAALLEQVVINLMQNAFQASRPGQEITLRTRQKDNQAFLVVEDHGVGISEGNLKHIFEPFFTTKEAGEGTGLGLFVSYGIVHDHGGELRVESEEGRGATFTMSLPLAN